MASLSGTVVRGDNRSVQDVAEDLFSRLVVSGPQKRRRGYALPLSFVGHTVAIALLILVPVFWTDSPDTPDYIRALIYNPPPPPPPPLPKGSALVETLKPARPVAPDPVPDPDRLVTPVDKPQETPIKPEPRDREDQQAGSPTGSDIGVAEGMDIGVDGGVVGGVPGGVIGGVVGGTGDGPVMDYDQPPRPIRITQPKYPQDAFVKKIEGTVEVEILIDSTGRVVKARVMRSIPALDEAARQTVLQWQFAPAMKHGRPVATLATAPVTFRIF
jgi:periplasmic protein TonB